MDRTTEVSNVVNFNQTPPEDAPVKEAPDPIVLPDVFNDALMGHTVAFDEFPRMVYSLNRLAGIYRTMDNLPDEEAARRRVWDLVQNFTREFGKNCPVFVDDAAFAKETPKIWTPGK